MKIKTFTKFCLLLASTFAFSLLKAQPAPFYQETFPNAAAFTDNWTQGGTNAGSADWVWSNDPSGVFQGQPDFASTTASNGFIIFNSDANGDFSHDVFVTSKAIDCSGRNTVFLRCENQYGFFSPGGVSIAEVGVSTDGTTFTYRQVLANVPRNDLSDPVQVVTLELPEAANQPSVRIRFRWRGQFEYIWRIDDIGLYDGNPTPANDLAVDLPRIPFNFATPLSQVDEESFIIRVENVGTMPQTNVTAQISVTGDNGDSFTASEVIGTLAPMEDDTVQFANTFSASNVGNYTFTYSVSQTETDAFPSDNSLGGEFVITQNLFAKDDGTIAGANQPATIVGDFWEIGNLYTIVNEGFEAYEASFSIASNDDAALVGQDINVFLYRLEDNGDSTFDDDDLSIVGLGTKTLEATDTSFSLITVDLIPLVGELEPGVMLEPGDYFITVELSEDMFIVYSALPYYYDFSTVVRNGEWFLGGFGPDVTAITRMRIREISTSTKEPQLADNQVEIYPNPVQNNLNVKIALEKVTNQAQLTVMDAMGKTIAVRNYEGIKDQTITLDANSWAAGTYFLHVRTDAGVKTKRLVVQH